MGRDGDWVRTLEQPKEYASMRLDHQMHLSEWVLCLNDEWQLRTFAIQKMHAHT